MPRTTQNAEWELRGMQSYTLSSKNWLIEDRKGLYKVSWLWEDRSLAEAKELRGIYND